MTLPDSTGRLSRSNLIRLKSAYKLRLCVWFRDKRNAKTRAEEITKYVGDVGFASLLRTGKYYLGK